MKEKPPALAQVTHSFDADPEKVFDAWIQADLIGQWMFGPAVRDEEVLKITVDARVGGQYSFLVKRNGEEIDHVGVYEQVTRPRRLVFSWGVRADLPLASRVVVDIAFLVSGCQLKLTHELDPDWAEYVPRVQESWTKMLGALAKLLADG